MVPEQGLPEHHLRHRHCADPHHGTVNLPWLQMQLILQTSSMSGRQQLLRALVPLKAFAFACFCCSLFVLLSF